MRVSVSMPCYLRPQRTKRAIECIMNQNINGWEALIGGDNCPNIQSLIESGYFQDLSRTCEDKGNKLVAYNLERNHGGYGYEITNRNIQQASGNYFIFFANDDMILPNHFENYLSMMERDSTIDMGIFKTYIEPFGGDKDPKIAFGELGHSQIIIRTSLAKLLPPHSPKYDHDFAFIKNVLDRKARVEISYNPSTYIVKSVPTKLEVEID